MEVPGDIKGDLCNMKTHLDQRNGALRLTCPASDARGFWTFPEFAPAPSGPVLNGNVMDLIEGSRLGLPPVTGHAPA